MFIRTLTSKYILSLIKYTGCALLLACLVAVQGVAEDLDSNMTISNLSDTNPGYENINLRNAGNEITLTLVNTEDTAYSGILSALYNHYGETLLNTSAKVIITTTNQNSSILTLNPDNGYANFAGSVTVEGANSSHAEGVLNLATPNIFSPLVFDSHNGYTPSITNNGTIIINANQALPNLSGSSTRATIQINSSDYTLTLANTDHTVYSGDISGAGQIIITTPKWGSSAQLTLSKEGGYADFTGSVTIQAPGETPEDSHPQGVLLTSSNIFYNASSITNDGTLIVSSDQVLPNLSGSSSRATIQITSNDDIVVNTLTFKNNKEDTIYSGTITGSDGTDTWSGNIIKTGSKKLTLSHYSQLQVTGTITVKEGTLELTGNSLFNENTPPTVIINDNAKIIADGNKQYFKNLVGSGDLEILEDTDVISSYDEGEYEFSGKIYGNGDFEKKGKGALTLSGANSISGTITISDGKIRLIEDAIAASERIEGRSKGKVEYYVADDVTETLYIPNDSKHVQVKSIEKTGNGDLQIYVGATGCVSAESFVISSGRVDYGGYFQSIAPEGQELGTFDVNGGNTFSPGLTVDEHGETINTVGRFEITNEVSLNIKENALALFEFDVYSEELYLNNEELFLQTFDRIVFQHEDSTFVAADSTIDLAFLSGDVSDWAKEGNEYWIVNDHGFKDKEGNPIPEGESVNFDNLLRNTYKDYFSLEGRYNGLYLVGKGAPVLLVPEPSSWALMIGTLLTFLFLKKKRG